MSSESTNKEMMKDILQGLGSKANINSAMNCMTRLRFYVKDDSKVDEESLKAIEGVMGVVHDRANHVEVVVGPGKSRKLADLARDMGISTADQSGEEVDWKQNKADIKANQKESKLKQVLKTFGDIFVPLIPGVIAAGLCAGFATLIGQLVPNREEIPAWNIIWNFLTLVNQSFMSILPAWAGYRAAEKLGGTPILGGMLGMITGLDGINAISKTIGLFNEEQPLNAILRAGRGGVLAAIIGVYFLVKLERWIRSRMPDSVDIVFTPLLSLLLILIPHIFIIMPVTGYISHGLVWIVEHLAMNDNVIIRMLCGYVASALFLPMVAMGMHHGLVAFYTVQLEELGYVTLYPALAMAGAGQVGAAIALYQKAKKVDNDKIQKVIRGAMPAGILGVGEPLIYGVTLPMGKPFITAGLGAGFGGAFVMAMQVASTTWGPSGLLAFPVMTAGPNGGVKSMVFYGIGLVISYVMGYIITNAAIKAEEVKAA